MILSFNSVVSWITQCRSAETACLRVRQESLMDSDGIIAWALSLQRTVGPTSQCKESKFGGWTFRRRHGGCPGGRPESKSWKNEHFTADLHDPREVHKSFSQTFLGFGSLNGGLSGYDGVAPGIRQGKGSRLVVFPRHEPGPPLQPQPHSPLPLWLEGGVGVPARGVQPVRGQAAWEYHKLGAPHELGPLVSLQGKQ